MAACLMLAGYSKLKPADASHLAAAPRFQRGRDAYIR